MGTTAEIGNYYTQLAALDETEEAALERKRQLIEENENLERSVVDLRQQFEESYTAMTESGDEFFRITRDNILEWMDLTDDQIKSLESFESAATDVFRKIGEAAALSVDEMNENLDHNLEVIESWSDNLTIAQRVL